MSNPSLLCVPYRFKTSKLYSQIPDSGLGDFTVTRSASNAATRVNAQGFIETVADNVPRLDYPLGGITAGCPALLVEPAATNGIRNNSMVGAVVGSPGTLPTNWILGGVGLVQQIVAVGTENGVSYIDLRLSGIATSGTATLSFESATQIAALTGQNWTISSYLKTIALPSPPVSFVLAITERTSGGAIVTQQTTSVSLTSTLTRYSYSPTLNGGATTAFAQPRLFFTLFVGQTYDFTVRIGYPQMELGSVATSVIPTTTTAITRAADVVNKTGVSSLIGQTQGTIYAEVDVRNFANAGIFFSISDGTSSNRVQVYKFTDSKIYADRISATQSALTSISTSALSTGIYKLAFAYKTGDSALFINGVQIGSTALQTFTMGALTKVNVGTRFDNTQFLNDRIRAAALYNTRLTNAELQSLTQ